MEQHTLRMYLIVRQDLEIPFGKALGSAGHAFEGALEAADKLSPAEALIYRKVGNRKKIVLRIKTLAKLLALRTKLEENTIPHHLVTDAGLTVFPEPTITFLAFGPVTEEQGRELTKGLQLLQ